MLFRSMGFKMPISPASVHPDESRPASRSYCCTVHNFSQGTASGAAPSFPLKAIQARRRIRIASWQPFCANCHNIYELINAELSLDRLIVVSNAASVSGVPKW